MNRVSQAVELGPIPLVDVAAQNATLREELDAAVAEIVSTSQFIGGPIVDAFAEQFADYCGVRRAIPCGNGTEALRLAILGVLGEGDGVDEVITVSHTFGATVEAIAAARYKPVMVDVDPGTYVMDLDRLDAHRTERTVAVVPVHLYGRMVDMPRLRAWADRFGLAVIEDAAQAHGAKFDGVGPGQLGDAASFSFFPGKNLGAWGDAGAVICNNKEIASRIARLADHGRSDKFTHVSVGSNSRMDAIQAAVLSVKLQHLDEWNMARKRAAGWYDEVLASENECVRPAGRAGVDHVYHLYVIQVANRKRERIRTALREAGIATGVHYPIPVHEQPAYRHLAPGPDSLPVTHDLCKRILSLPMYPQISRAQVERVAESVCRAATEVGMDA